MTYDKVVALLKKEQASDQAVVDAVEMFIRALLNEDNPDGIVAFLEQAQIHGENVSRFWKMCDRDPKKVSACIAIARMCGKGDYSKDGLRRRVVEGDKQFFDQFFQRTRGRLL